MHTQSIPIPSLSKSEIRRAYEQSAPVVQTIRRQAVIDRHGSQCYICDRTLAVGDVHLDHVVPVSRGGEHSNRNLRPACSDCNGQKGNRLWHELVFLNAEMAERVRDAIEEMAGDSLDEEYRAMGDDQPTGSDTTMVSVAEAARRLGVTHDAVRARLHRGSLQGRKVEGLWRVELPAETASAEPDDTTQQDTTTGQSDAPTVDITPLAEVIERQTKQISELSAAVGMWQARAMHLEEQVKQLTATAESTGGDADDVVSGPESVEGSDQDAGEGDEPEASPGGVWARFRRWWTGG